LSEEIEHPLDLAQLFRVLAEQRVDYLVIGGVAAQVHGRRRTTRDLDVLPAPTSENFKRLEAALLALEASPVEFGPGGPTPTAEQMRVAPIVPPLRTTHGDLQILNEVPGARDYEGMRERALAIDLDGTTMQIVGVDDLIRMKKAAGRLGDLEDIEALSRVADREGSGKDDRSR
jgi:predicted nucleotidyltransferase